MCVVFILGAAVLGFAVGGPRDRTTAAIGGMVCAYLGFMPLVGLHGLGRLVQRWKLYRLKFRLHDAHGQPPDLLWPAHLDRGEQGLLRVQLAWVAGQLLVLEGEQAPPLLQWDAKRVGAIECLPPPNIVRWLFGYGVLALVAPDRDTTELSLQGAGRAALLLRGLQKEALAGPEQV